MPCLHVLKGKHLHSADNEGFMHKLPFRRELSEVAFVIIIAILVGYLSRLMLGAMLSTPIVSE
jgi:hypothetical protein